MEIKDGWGGSSGARDSPEVLRSPGAWPELSLQRPALTQKDGPSKGNPIPSLAHIL